MVVFGARTLSLYGTAFVRRIRYSADRLFRMKTWFCWNAITWM
jgi:hypothetical protein